MDRLICGDVGYGKTEVAIRAAFKAVEAGRQVAVLCPTTVLSEQHERTFRERMAEYPVTVAALNRFRSAQEVRATVEGLMDGSVDIVIGTHRILSEDVSFKDLGLVIVDEEQRFGVEHKSKLMRFRVTVDVLTLSATPIPRTLHMALLGLRDISSLSTPPADRRAVVTEVIPYDRKRIRSAIVRELNRNGQVFYVHNRVQSIRGVEAELRQLVPEAKIVVGHGQMGGKELEEVMLKFVRHEADVLLSTTIIESGIDIPTANTMIIADGDRFGLAELHQLRGRVGRYKHRAYCYVMLPESRAVSDVAQRRLRAIEEFNMLGARHGASGGGQHPGAGTERSHCGGGL
jgi:transcription-repair coupling factor (superfamily II helicase)